MPSSRTVPIAPAVHWSEIDAPFGPFTVISTDVGVVGTWFGPGADAVAPLQRELEPAAVVQDGPFVTEARRQLEQYLHGDRRAFDGAIDWRRAHGFRAAVLRELLTVGYGTTLSYGELARRAGRPGAAQAVGTAMATNPLPIIVPCHRVIRRGGALGGFAGARHAVATKQWLLALEGAVLV